MATTSSVPRGGDRPAVAVTAYAPPEDAARSRAAGFRIHDPTLIDPDVLLPAVEGVARAHQRRVRG